MNSFSKAALATVLVAGGWMTIAGLYAGSARAVTFQLQPAHHDAYNAKAIDRSIQFQQARVKTDPGGAIGWGMLSEAWLARSRESDSDQAAWEAEAAARKSLALREEGNNRGIVCLVNSLLEQHRFQDALKTLEHYHVRNRLTADVLIELGRYEEAEKLLKSLNKEEDPTIGSTFAHLASVKGDHKSALKLLTSTREVLLSNPGVPQSTLAWFDVKLGDEYRAMGELAAAEKLYLGAIKVHPRNYKANIAMARVRTAQKNWAGCIEYGQATLEIADSLDAKSLIADAYEAMGDTANADRWLEICHRSYLNEVAKFDSMGKGGDFKVRPIDRQFATFSAEHKRFVDDGLVAAKRDLANRPDPHAKQTLTTLEALNQETAK